MRFRVLGPLEVTGADGPIALGGPKQRTVLAHLLLAANRVVSTEQLIDAVWGDEPPGSARNTLQSYVSSLRGVLGDDRLVHRPPGYSLVVAPEEVDALRFETLLRDARKAAPVDPRTSLGLLDDALALWRGEALADVADRQSLAGEATRLDELRLAAQEDRIEALLAAGEHARAASDLERLLSEHPLRERLWAGLMLALYRDGRQSEALQAFQRAREILADELGIDPSPELARRHEQVLRHDPALDLDGEPLRGYRLLERIGEGRLGAVFRALQPHVGRDVAVRVIPERIASAPAFVRRFEHDARAVASLEHPHVAPIYDYWREPQGAYVVMRYLAGGSLGSALERGVLDDGAAARILGHVAEALAFAHDRGVAHGAVTPSNVLLDGDGNAYLADFPIGTREASPAGDRRALQELTRELLGASAGAEVDGVAQVALPDGAERPGPSRNPYKGLRPFTEIDAADFFGRRGLVGRLVALLNDDGPGSRFLAVVGPSGSGKSSVVRAGLVPAVLTGAVGVLDRCVIATMHPGVHPIEELESALLAVASQRPPNLLHQLESGPRGLLDVVAAVAPPDAEILLVVDQFEEVFTLTRREEERELFLEALRVAVADPSSRLRVVVTLRADHFDRPLAHARFAELLGARHVTVPPLTADELEQAIRLPAEGVGARPDPGLVAAIVSDVANQPGALPLLQHALTEIFQRRVDGRLTLEAYTEIGGAGGALSATADRLVDDIAPGRRELVRQLFLRLVTLGEGRPDTRRRVTRSELTVLDVHPEPIEAILDAFGRHRLLTFDREPATREPTVEIAHEALLTGWARLRGWIDAAREDLRRERRLARAAAEWHAAGRDPSFLMSGARLEQLEAWASTTTVALGIHEREYLAASTQLRERRESEDRARAERERGIERRSQRRLRGLVAVLAVGALVASGLTVVATREREEASRQSRLATARELAASSVANLEVDPERSILLALEAIRTTRAADGTVLPEAEEALHRAMTASRVVLSVPDIGGAVDWNPDGTTFVTEGPDESGIVDVRDAVTGASVLAFPGHELDVNMGVFAPDGATLATTGDDGDVRVWDAGTGDEVWGFDGPTGVVRVPSFSPDGSLLAAPFVDEGVVRVWNLETRELVQELPGLGPGESTAFSADGRRLAVTSWTGAVVVVDVASGDRVADIDAGNDVKDVDWSPDGRWIATGDRGGIARIWDAATFEGRQRLFGHTDEVTTVDWSPDSSRLVTGGADGFAKVWRIRDDATEELFSFSTGGGGIYATFSPDGRSVLTGEQSIGRATIWDVGIRGDAELANVPVPGLFGGVTFTADGAGVAASNGDGSVTIWDPATGDGIATFGRRDPSFGPLRGEPWCVTHTLEPSPDGELLASAGQCTTVWDVSTGETVYDHVAPGEFTTDVTWAPGSDLLAIAEGDRDVTIVDRTGERVGEVSEEPDFFVEPAAFSADGELLATGRLRETRPDPDATRVAIWDWRRGELVTSIPAWPMSLSFAPTGDRIAIASLFSVAEIWDARTGVKLATLSGHRGVVNDVAFGPDGSTVATAGSDGTARIWDAATGALRLTLRGPHGAVTDVAFSPDGTMLVTSGRDGVGRIWALELDALIDLARDELTRGFTEDECRRYLHRPCGPADGAVP